MGIAGGSPKGSRSESPGPLHAEMLIRWCSIMLMQTDKSLELSCRCGENPLGMPSGTRSFRHQEPHSSQKSKVLPSELSDHTQAIPGHRCGRTMEALPFPPISCNSRSDLIDLVDKR